MAGHSRPKDGVASLAYVPAIHALFGKEEKAWMPGTRPGMTWLGHTRGWIPGSRLMGAPRNDSG